MDMSVIEQEAEETLKLAEYPSTKEMVDVIDVAKRLGFVIGNAVLNDEDDGFIVVEEGKEELMGFRTDKIIGVNSDRTLEWKRFIIAHELGHYMLHCRKEKQQGLYAHRVHTTGHNQSEDEADFFATNLLMPREIFTEKYNRLKEKDMEKQEIVDALARKFIVTSEMTLQRIEELNLG